MSTNAAAPMGADMALKFASPIVTFLVGPQKFRFNVHKDVLCQAPAGSFFQKVFGGSGLKEAKQLPEDGPDEVQFFVDSLYGVWMGTSKAPDAFDCAGLQFSQEIKLYVFAQRYACRDLQNAIILDMLLHEPDCHWTGARAGFSRQDLEYFDDHLHDTTPMHKLLSLWLIKDVFNKSDRIHLTDETLNELPEFLVRAAFEHVLKFPDSVCTDTWFEKESFMVPGDTVVEQNKRPRDDNTVDHTNLWPSKRSKLQRAQFV